MYQPVYQPVRRPMVEYAKTVVSDIMLVLGIVLSLFLVWLGAVIWGWSNDPDVQDVGMFIRSLGMFILTAAMFVGALLRTDWDKWVRFGVLLSATLILICIGYWSGFWSLLGGLNLNFPGL